MLKKAALKKCDQFFRQETKEINLTLLQLDQIQQDNADARDGINKYIATIRKEESVSF